MKYPYLNSWLLYKKEDEYTWCVKDYLNDHVYFFDIEEVHFMRQLNGKRNPYKINPAWSKSEVRQFLDFLEEKELTRNSRAIRSSFLTFNISLIRIRRNMKVRLISFILNAILMVTFLPVFAAGVYCCLNKIYTYEISYLPFYFGTILGLIVGLILHETGHAISGLAYGAKVFEAGLMIGIPIGAYVMLDESNVKSRLRRCQILASGVEMNFLLCGIGFIFSSLIPFMSNFFYGFAVDNLILGVINLLLINGLDGCSIMEELLGTRSLSLSAVDFVLNHKSRKNLLLQGATGYIKIASGFVGAVCQLAYPLLLLLNVAEVISCLV